MQMQTNCYGKMEKRSQWIDLLMRYRVLLFIATVVALTFATKATTAFAQEFKKASDCVVGKRVVNRDGQAGVIDLAEGTSCRVKLDATGKSDYNIFWMLRPEVGTGKAASGAKAGKETGSGQATASAGIPTGKYQCYMLAGTMLNYAFIDIHIEGPNRYRDKSGKTGTYSLADNQKIVFSGSLASANAKLLPGGNIGLNMNGGSFYNTTCNR